MKGCLVNILKKILLIALVVAFFAFGGYAFVKDKIKNYQYPTREAFVESEKGYGDFSGVSGDYQLYRSFNLFGYKKVNAKYLPTGQKITIFDLKDEDFISVSDFYTDEISEKIQKIVNKAKDAIITYEDFEFISKGRYTAGKDIIPYVAYKAKVKNIPFKEVVGTLAAYSTSNDDQKASTKLIFTIIDSKAYNPNIVRDFVNSIRISAN